MRLHILALAAVLALAAGCNKGPDNRQPASRADTPPSQPQATTPSTPAPAASAGPSASPEEKKEGANPTQGQVDPKAGEQHRDFQQKGDSAGPKSPDTAPKSGG
jgi:predicted small lipoprotein YifL